MKVAAIKVYNTNDNGIFNTLEFMEEMFNKRQNMRFSGDGASHKNGAAERIIKTVVNMASTMLMHAALIYPKDTFSTGFGQ